MAQEHRSKDRAVVERARIDVRGGSGRGKYMYKSQMRTEEQNGECSYKGK